MEKSQELVRTISRSFFPPSHTIIIEALLHHSALTLAEVRSFFASGGRPKSELSSWLAELERGGLVSKYVRAEQRRANRSQQKQGAGGTVYYYIDYRKAVDASNYRLHSLEQKCTKHSNPSAADEKSCQCTTCKTEYTQLKLMESRDLLGRGSGFKCKVCGEIVSPPARSKSSGGDTMIGCFNKQFLPIINLLGQIDRLEVPAVTPESALAAAIPLRKRDASAPQYLKSEMEMEEEKVRPMAVKGTTKIDAEKIDVSITAKNENSAAAQAAARVHRDHIAMQNAMPEWYTRSTIGEDSSKAGRSSVNTPGNTATTYGVAKAGEEKGSLNKEEQDELQNFFAALEQQKREQQEQGGEEEEEDDDEEDEFEDVSEVNGTADSKRPLEDDSASNAASTPGANRLKLDVSAGTPAAEGESDADDESEEVKM